MQLPKSLLLTCLYTSVLGAPVAEPAAVQIQKRSTLAAPWDEGAVREFPIHKSCNATERRQLQRGLDDTVTLAKHAKDHVLRYGNDSAIYRKYFGNAPSAHVVGNFERIVAGDKADVLFRCDDPDGNCKLPAWGGHWRGENATGETVICELSFTTRLYLEQFCTRGYNVANSPLNTYFGIDLIHRLFHIPAIGENAVEHFADTYEDILELGAHNGTFATRDSNSLQYFAAEVYGYDIAVPGVGCAGEPASKTSTTSAVPTMAPTTEPSATKSTQQSASATLDIPPVGPVPFVNAWSKAAF
ncbi:hypothetical protein AJ80_00036 [Polytolypa hystricis UAMH7299]|uniref:Putative peptidase domain-containing protein n=1 Tax=Polytolypa hystricis (strain UAMH7299) TaxID=1447883 RepID=A0A2B7Z2J7_POLH7|nr:hypothetical protein AJ80_00036 [Polytolypa hystricis UAMH7299]